MPDREAIKYAALKDDDMIRIRGLVVEGWTVDKAAKFQDDGALPHPHALRPHHAHDCAGREVQALPGGLQDHGGEGVKYALSFAVYAAARCFAEALGAKRWALCFRDIWVTATGMLIGVMACHLP